MLVVSAKAALVDAESQLLVPPYLDIDNRKVFASLQHLEDLRAFAARVRELVSER